LYGELRDGQQLHNGSRATLSSFLGFLLMKELIGFPFTDLQMLSEFGDTDLIRFGSILD
jgi:hypothetical protein